MEFEVVALIEDEEENAFAVAYSGAADEYIVTDAEGTILSDDELAQSILDDFLEVSSGDEEAPSNDGQAPA